MERLPSQYKGEQNITPNVASEKTDGGSFSSKIAKNLKAAQTKIVETFLISAQKDQAIVHKRLDQCEGERRKSVTYSSSFSDLHKAFDPTGNDVNILGVQTLATGTASTSKEPVDKRTSNVAEKIWNAIASPFRAIGRRLSNIKFSFWKSNTNKTTKTTTQVCTKAVLPQNKLSTTGEQFRTAYKNASIAALEKYNNALEAHKEGDTPLTTKEKLAFLQLLAKSEEIAKALQTLEKLGPGTSELQKAICNNLEAQCKEFEAEAKRNQESTEGKPASALSAAYQKESEILKSAIKSKQDSLVTSDNVDKGATEATQQPMTRILEIACNDPNLVKDAIGLFVEVPSLTSASDFSNLSKDQLSTLREIVSETQDKLSKDLITEKNPEKRDKIEGDLRALSETNVKIKDATKVVQERLNTEKFEANLRGASNLAKGQFKAALDRAFLLQKHTDPAPTTAQKQAFLDWVNLKHHIMDEIKSLTTDKGKLAEAPFIRIARLQLLVQECTSSPIKEDSPFHEKYVDESTSMVALIQDHANGITPAKQTPISPLLEIACEHPSLAEEAIKLLGNFQDVTDLQKLPSNELIDLNKFAATARQQLTKDLAEAKKIPNNDAAINAIKTNLAKLNAFTKEVEQAEAAVLEAGIKAADPKVGGAIKIFEEIVGANYAITVETKLALLAYFTQEGKVKYDEDRVNGFYVMMQSANAAKHDNLKLYAGGKHPIKFTAPATNLLVEAFQYGEPVLKITYSQILTQFCSKTVALAIGEQENKQIITDTLTLAVKTSGELRGDLKTEDDHGLRHVADSYATDAESIAHLSESEQQLVRDGFVLESNGIYSKTEWSGLEGSARTYKVTLALPDSTSTDGIRKVVIEGKIDLQPFIDIGIDDKDKQYELIKIVKEIATSQGSHSYLKVSEDRNLKGITRNDEKLQLSDNENFWNWIADPDNCYIIPPATEQSMKEIQKQVLAKLDLIVKTTKDFGDNVFPKYYAACINLGNPAP